MSTPEPNYAQQRLAEAVSAYAARGYRLESSTPTQAVMVAGKPVNHVLHLLITLFTCGLWAIVWILLAVSGGEERRFLTADQYGNVSAIEN